MNRGRKRRKPKLSAMGPAIVIKVIMDEVGFQSIPQMVKAGLQVSATAVNSVGRAILAAKCGAHYMIPYYGWPEDSHERSTHLISRRHGDLSSSAISNEDARVLPPHGGRHRGGQGRGLGRAAGAADLQRFFDHPHSAVAVEGHRASWDARYGKDTTWLDFLAGHAAGSSKL